MMARASGTKEVSASGKIRDRLFYFTRMECMAIGASPLGSFHQKQAVLKIIYNRYFQVASTL